MYSPQNHPFIRFFRELFFKLGPGGPLRCTFSVFPTVAQEAGLNELVTWSR